MTDSLKFLALALPLFHLIGVISAVRAVMTARTSQGAIAWAVALVSFPYLAVPLYWVLGRNRFHGYVTARRAGNAAVREVAEKLENDLAAFRPPDGILTESEEAFEKLAGIPFTSGNRAKLLIDGDETFEAIFEAIEVAQSYVLIEFFCIEGDRLGNRLKDVLKSVAGSVRIYVLFDEVGSHNLPKQYLEELRAAGIKIRPFHTTAGRWNKFQINFRNHRKIVVVDGHRAFIGGSNVGDQYMGWSEKFGPWRDTHTQLEGPAALGAQLTFFEDWHWAAREALDLSWTPVAAEDADINALVIAAGPADELETCDLFYVQAIHGAKRRLWITSPYLVPDPQVVAALQLAVFRGVDVRIIIPEMADHPTVWYAAFSYYEELIPAGVRIFRYQTGFMHQRVMLVDDDYASVGTANFDNRSFRLNFEITVIYADRDFCREVEAMLESDLSKTREVKSGELEARSFLFRLKVRLARLTAAIQ